MEHKQLEEAIAAFALGATDDASIGVTERALLEHLAGCASCRELFANMRDVAAELALAPSPLAVPAEVEERIFEAIRERRPGPSATSRSRSRSLIARLGAVAVAAAIVGLFAWNLQLASRVRSTRTKSAEVAMAMTVLGSPDSHAVSLTGPRAHLVFVYRPGEAFLVGENVEPLPSGKVLQLWLMRAGVPTSAGVFTPDGGVVVGPVSQSLSTYSTFDGVAVTIERGPDGARAPTSDPLYSGTITA